MKKIITTVGTSIFNDDIDNRGYLDKPFSEMSEKRNQKIIESLFLKIQHDKGNIAEYSAEIKSLKTYSDDSQQDLEVYFITTDTVASNLSAEILEKIFQECSEKFNYKIETKCIKRVIDLNIDRYDRFEIGIDGLIRYISQLMDEIESSYHNKKFYQIRKEMRKDVVFNITGGYKGIIPIMTILAQLYECEILYIFENSNDKITIPRLPLNFDPFLTEALYMDLWMLKENYCSISNKDKLVDFNFITKKNKITALGYLFIKMVEKNQPIAKNVVGYFVEYKILENIYNSNEKQVNHSYVSDDKRELDFAFLNDKNEVEKAWEIKPVTSLLFKDRFDSILEQISNQIEDYPSIKTYKLIVYTLNNNILEKIKNYAESMIKCLRNRYIDIDFQVSLLRIDNMTIKKQNNTDNPYQSLFKSKVKDSDFIKIHLEDNNE